MNNKLFVNFRRFSAAADMRKRRHAATQNLKAGTVRCPPKSVVSKLMYRNAYSEIT